MKKSFCLLCVVIAITFSYGQGSQKINGTSGSSGTVVDSAAIMKKLQADWNKYLTDSLYKKETIKDFLDWFDTHLSNKDYQSEFSSKFMPYYNLWLQNKYSDWYLRRSKKE